MLSNKRLRQLDLCRNCLNSHSRFRFNSRELRYRYSYYHFKCAECGEMRHIVTQVRFPYSLKLMFVENISQKTQEELQLEKQIKKEKRRMKIFKKLNW